MLRSMTFTAAYSVGQVARLRKPDQFRRERKAYLRRRPASSAHHIGRQNVHHREGAVVGTGAVVRALILPLPTAIIVGSGRACHSAAAGRDAEGRFTGAGPWIAPGGF